MPTIGVRAMSPKVPMTTGTLSMTAFPKVDTQPMTTRSPASRPQRNRVVSVVEAKKKTMGR